MQPATHTLTILIDDDRRTLQAPHGANLRRTLLDAGVSPYGALTQRLNCGGRGICATCGVWIESGEPLPDHWHDRAAATFGYPRLSCQIKVTDDMTVRILTDKGIWGPRDPQRRYKSSSRA